MTVDVEGNMDEIARYLEADMELGFLDAPMFAAQTNVGPNRHVGGRLFGVRRSRP
jgi:hypothetical protein